MKSNELSLNHVSVEMGLPHSVPLKFPLSYVGNYTDAPVAGWFLSNVADSYGVNPGQVFHPGKPILNLPTGLSSQIGQRLRYAELPAGRAGRVSPQQNMFQHGAGVPDVMRPHAHFGLYTSWQSNLFARANSPNYLSPNWGYFEQQRTGVNWI